MKDVIVNERHPLLGNLKPGEHVTVHYHLGRAKQGLPQRWSVRAAINPMDIGKPSRYRVVAYVETCILTDAKPTYQMGAVARINREGGTREVYAKIEGTWTENLDRVPRLERVHLNPRRNGGRFTLGRAGQEWWGDDVVFFPGNSGTVQVGS